MSGYTKRMMEEAAAWLKANPDVKDPFLRVPLVIAGIDKPAQKTTSAEHTRWAAALKRSDIDEGTKQAIRENIERIKAAEHEVDAVRDELAQSVDSLQRSLNASPVVGHASYSNPDPTYKVDLGRWFLSWARNGYNVFDLSSDFVAAMLLTDPKEIAFDELKLPFEGLLIIVPDGFAIGADGRSYTKIHVTQICNHACALLEVGEKVDAVLAGLPSESIHAVLQQADATLRETADKSPVAAVAMGGQYSLISRSAIHIHAHDGVKVLDTMLMEQDLSWQAFEALPDFVTEPKDKEARRTIGQVVFGMLAYLTAVKGSAVERTEPTKKRKLSNEPKTKFWDVGRTIKLQPELVRLVRSGVREVALRLKHRHIVMGHYRNQAHGVGRKDRKRIWIAPFWKGPEDGAALVHTYKPEAAI